MSIFDEVTQRISSQTNTAISGVVKGFSPLGAATAVATTAVGQLAPQASGALSKALRGDFVGAGLDVLRQTGVGQAINKAITSSAGANLLYQSTRNPLLGGLTPLEASQVMQQVQSTAYAKKNLYYIEITDFDPRVSGTGQNTSGLFNLFAINVSLNPITLTGDTHQIGGAVMDALSGAERTDVQVTTLDDAAGSIQTWFATRTNLAVPRDGTFGVPADHLVQVRIIAASVNEDAAAIFGGFASRYICRVGSLSTELDRREDGMQEINMTFHQFDTFMF